jgi:hypothetical protein
MIPSSEPAPGRNPIGSAGSVGGPLTNVSHQRPHRLAVERLDIEELVVAHRDRIDREVVEPIGARGRSNAGGREQFKQQAEVVASFLRKSVRCHHRLQPLLDRLLSMEPDGLIIDLRVRGKTSHRLRVTVRLTGEDAR